MRLNRFQTDESIDQRSALFILDDLSSKYFQSAAQSIKMCKGVLVIFKKLGAEATVLEVEVCDVVRRHWSAEN